MPFSLWGSTLQPPELCVLCLSLGPSLLGCSIYFSWTLFFLLAPAASHVCHTHLKVPSAWAEELRCALVMLLQLAELSNRILEEAENTLCLHCLVQQPRATWGCWVFEIVIVMTIIIKNNFVSHARRKTKGSQRLPLEKLQNHLIWRGDQRVFSQKMWRWVWEYFRVLVS